MWCARKYNHCGGADPGKEKECLLCVESGGWCRGDDGLWSGKVCRQVQDPEEICERIMEMPWEGRLYAGYTASPSGRHTPAMWKLQSELHGRQ